MVLADVRVWHDADGGGVVDSDSTPGGCWVHVSHLDGPLSLLRDA